MSRNLPLVLGGLAVVLLSAAASWVVGSAASTQVPAADSDAASAAARLRIEDRLEEFDRHLANVEDHQRTVDETALRALELAMEAAERTVPAPAAGVPAPAVPASSAPTEVTRAAPLSEEDGEAHEIDAENLERLRRLGYIGGE